MHELGSIDVMRLHKTLGQSHHVAVKAYVDFP
jgi:hypothetical protein